MKSACYSPSDDMLSAWRPIPIAVMIPLEKVGSGWRGSQSPPPSCAEDLPTRLLARVTQAHTDTSSVVCSRSASTPSTIGKHAVRAPRQNCWRHSPATRARCDRRQGQEVCALRV